MPVVIELGVDLALVLAFLVALGFLAVYRGAIAPTLILFAALLGAIRVGGFGHYARPFGGAAEWIVNKTAAIDHEIAALVLATQKGVVLLWHGLAYQVRLLGGLLGDLAETIESRFHRLLFAFPPAALLWLAVRAVQALPRLRGDLHTAKARANAAYAAVVAEGAWVRGKFRTAERERVNLSRRVRSLSRHFTKAGAAALVGAALATLGLGWLRCPRVGRLGKRACSMDAGLLDALLEGTLILGGAFSLVTFAHELQDVTEEVGRGITTFARIDLTPG